MSSINYQLNQLDVNTFVTLAPRINVTGLELSDVKLAFDNQDNESIWVDMSRVLKLQITEFPSWGRFPARSACLDFWILRGLDFEGPTLSVETCQDPKACFAAAMSSLEVLSTDSSFRMLGLESCLVWRVGGLSVSTTVPSSPTGCLVLWSYKRLILLPRLSPRSLSMVEPLQIPMASPIRRRYAIEWTAQYG